MGGILWDGVAGGSRWCCVGYFYVFLWEGEYIWQMMVQQTWERERFFGPQIEYAKRGNNMFMCFVLPLSGPLSPRRRERALGGPLVLSRPCHQFRLWMPFKKDLLSAVFRRGVSNIHLLTGLATMIKKTQNKSIPMRCFLMCCCL